MTFPVLGGDSLDTYKVIESVKGSGLKLIISTFYQEGADPEFDSGFREYLNSDPENIKKQQRQRRNSSIFRNVIRRSSRSREGRSVYGFPLNDAMWSVKISGASGEIAFDETGDAIRGSAILKLVDTQAGKWKFLTIQEVGD